MSQNTTQEKNSKLLVLNISYFYSLFLRESKAYPVKDFAIDKKIKGRVRRKPTLQEYKKIVYEYLKTYFYELYLMPGKKYFFLGGIMRIVIIRSWINKQKRGYAKIKEYCKADKAFGLFWTLRPTPKMFIMVKIKKQTGSSNIIPKIERAFNQNQDKDLLPIFTDEQKKGKLNKTLYKCIQT